MVEIEGHKLRFHGKPQSHDEDDEELYESDSFYSDSEDENSAEDASSPNINCNGPLNELSSLMEHLPIKRGLSKYYQGKCESFTSLSDVQSVEDLPKKINPYAKKIKACKSYAGSDANQKFCQVPGPCSKTISKKAPRVSSCASLIPRTNSFGLMCSNKTSPVLAPIDSCPQ